jgi:hypothetical protein
MCVSSNQGPMHDASGLRRSFMGIDAGYFRLKCTLADGRKFYISKQGMIHLVREETTRMWLVATNANHPMCLLVTPFVGSGISYEIEPADSPIDPAAMVKCRCQDGKAVDAGVFRQG